MRDYRKLVVWEKAHSLVLSIYKATKAFPREEQYGLIGQIREQRRRPLQTLQKVVVDIHNWILQSTFNKHLAQYKKFNTYHFCLLN